MDVFSMASTEHDAQPHLLIEISRAEAILLLRVRYLQTTLQYILVDTPASLLFQPPTNQLIDRWFSALLWVAASQPVWVEQLRGLTILDP